MVNNRRSRVFQPKNKDILNQFFAFLYRLIPLPLLLNFICQNKSRSKFMTSLNPSNVIEIDDDDSKPIASKSKNNSQTIGIDPDSLPKLYLLLQKHTGQKIKQQPEQQKKAPQASEAVPEVMKPPTNETEVYKIVHITPSIPQAPPSQVQPQDIDSTPEKLIEHPNSLLQMVQNDILAVEQEFKPMIPVQPEKSLTSPEKCPDLEAQIKTKEANANEAMNVQYQALPDNSLQPDAVPAHDVAIEPEPISSFQQPNESPSELICQQAPQMQINESIILNNQHSIPQEQPAMIAQSEQIKTASPLGIIQKLTPPQIKRLLMNLLPEMSQAIDAMTDQQINDIFTGIKSETPQEQLFKIIKDQKLDQDFPAISAQLRVEPQKNKSPKIAEINPNWNELEVLQYLKTLPFEDLKATINQFFKYQNDPFNQMTYEGLIEILNESIALYSQSSNIPQQSQKNQEQKPYPQNIEHPKQILPSTHQQFNQILPSSPTIAEMRQFLSENISFTNKDQLPVVSDDYIRQLYEGGKNGQLSRAQIAKKIQNYTPSILDACLIKFPHLKDSLSRISPDELQTLLKSFSSTAMQVQKAPSQEIKPINLVNMPVNKPQKPVIDLQEESQPEPNQKRTHEVMMASTPFKSDDNKSESKCRKVSDLRAKLLTRLPDLRENIMKLDDNEIEKIYRDSLQRNQTSQPNKRSKESEPRPVIIMKETKPVAELFKKPENRSDPPISSHQQSAKTTTIHQDDKKKKTRTIIFVHTQQLSDDEPEISCKIRKTENGIQKKSSCECFHNASIGDLLKKLTELIEKKS